MTLAAGHAGTSANESGEQGGSRAKGGASHGHATGSALGKSDGNKPKVGYFWDPSNAHHGQEDVAPPNAVEGGMAGGSGKAGDHGIPEASGLVPVISVPAKVAAAVSIGMILILADIRQIADGAIMAATDVASEEALAKIIGDDLEVYAQSQASKMIASDPELAAASAEQQQLAAEIKTEAADRLAKELDLRIAADAGEEEKLKHASGDLKKWLESDAPAAQKELEAAKRARRAVGRVDERQEASSSTSTDRGPQADVDVSSELFNQGDDWYSPQAPQFRGAFSQGELDALQRFDSVLQEAGNKLPQTLPAIEALMETAEWKRIVAAAQIALQALIPRGPV